MNKLFTCILGLSTFLTAAEPELERWAQEKVGRIREHYTNALNILNAEHLMEEDQEEKIEEISLFVHSCTEQLLDKTEFKRGRNFPKELFERIKSSPLHRPPIGYIAAGYTAHDFSARFLSYYEKELLPVEGATTNLKIAMTILKKINELFQNKFKKNLKSFACPFFPSLISNHSGANKLIKEGYSGRAVPVLVYELANARQPLYRPAKLYEDLGKMNIPTGDEHATATSQALLDVSSAADVWSYGYVENAEFQRFKIMGTLLKRISPVLWSQNLGQFFLSIPEKLETKFSEVGTPKIINLSIGESPLNSIFKLLVSFKSEYEKHVKRVEQRVASFEELPDSLIVKSSGNDSMDIWWRPLTQAFLNLDNTILVGAIEPGNALTPYTNVPGTNKKAQENFLFTLGQVAALSYNDIIPGTSFSAPVVSGVAALLLDKHPHLTVAQLKESLLMSARRHFFVEENISGSKNRVVTKYIYEDEPLPQAVIAKMEQDQRGYKIRQEKFDPRFYGRGILDAHAADIYAQLKQGSTDSSYECTRKKVFTKLLEEQNNAAQKIQDAWRGWRKKSGWHVIRKNAVELGRGALSETIKRFSETPQEYAAKLPEYDSRTLEGIEIVDYSEVRSTFKLALKARDSEWVKLFLSEGFRYNQLLSDEDLIALFNARTNPRLPLRKQLIFLIRNGFPLKEPLEEFLDDPKKAERTYNNRSFHDAAIMGDLDEDLKWEVLMCTPTEKQEDTFRHLFKNEHVKESLNYVKEDMALLERGRSRKAILGMGGLFGAAAVLSKYFQR